jgi:hypothetical protein
MVDLSQHKFDGNVCLKCDKTIEELEDRKIVSCKPKIKLKTNSREKGKNRKYI